MKVLYVLWNYPQLSETYVIAEIAFALRSGVDVHVWAQIAQKAGIPEQCPVHRGTLAQAIADTNPDVIHVHYLVVAERHIQEIPASIPVTVRGHSFDWTPGLAIQIAELPSVRKVFLFPWFASQVSHPKIAGLPVAFSSGRFKEAPGKDRRMVLRLAAGLPTKGLIHFFSTAREMPDFRFVLVIATAGGYGGFDAELRRMNKLFDNRVDLQTDLSWDDAATLIHLAGINLHTCDPARNPFGMSISIAEALATGSLVLVPQCPEAVEYVGNAGRFYPSPAAAVPLIRETAGWDDEAWASVSRTARERAALFADTAVLPKLIDEWKSICGKDL